MRTIDVGESVVRKGSDEWEKEEEEDENEVGVGGRGGDLDVVVVVVVGVRGANASLEISAPRRLVSRPSPIGRREGGRGGEEGLSLPSPPPPSHNGRFGFHFGPQKGSVKERSARSLA